MTHRVIALLGRKDEPTDAVEEYCRYLGEALKTHDCQFEIHRVDWEIQGWPAALDGLRLRATEWRGTWVLVQYTALAWSLRGFPQNLVHALKILKAAGTRIAIVFHDVEPYSGLRLVDSLRRFVQLRTMRRALSLSDLAIFTVPPENIGWLEGIPQKIKFIPVGPNLPIPLTATVPTKQDELPTIGVFSITGGESGEHETCLILSAVRHAAQTLGKLRLLVFGRHAELREADLRIGLKDLPVELSVEGIAEPEQIVQKLSACDVLVFVRGGISSRRSSAIAGIACGVPVIAFSGSETAFPITDAGVVLVPPGQPDQLKAALVRVLSDAGYRKDLASRNRAAYLAHFAWTPIAARFADLLRSR